MEGEVEMEKEKEEVVVVDGDRGEELEVMVGDEVAVEVEIVDRMEDEVEVVTGDGVAAEDDELCIKLVESLVAGDELTVAPFDVTLLSTDKGVCVEVIEELADTDEPTVDVSAPVLGLELATVDDALNPVVDALAELAVEALEAKLGPDPDVAVQELEEVITKSDAVEPPSGPTTLAPQTCCNPTASPTSLFK